MPGYRKYRSRHFRHSWQSKKLKADEDIFLYNLPFLNIFFQFAIPEIRRATNYVLPLFDADSLDAHYCTFKLTDIPTIIDYIDFYDQYRISHLDIRFRPNFRVESPVDGSADNNDIPTNVIGRFPMYCWIDTDGIAAGTVLDLDRLDQIRAQQPTCHTWMNDQEHHFRMWPKPLQEIYDPNSLTLDGYMVDNTGGWIDSANSGVPHYGLWIMGPRLTVDYPFFGTPYGECITMEVTYFIEWKEQRGPISAAG